MGTVYLATEKEPPRRHVALKLLPEEFRNEDKRCAWFENEATMAGRINHPNVATIYYFTKMGDGQPAIAMEYVPGEPLSDLLARRDEPLSLTETVEIGVQIARGLAQAHRQGIVHRDLKPGNVMMTEEGQVKILDFGIAKALHLLNPGREVSPAIGAPTPDDSSPVAYTIGYSPPGQVKGEIIDARTDLFSLGVVLYELATGERPFDASQIESVLTTTPSYVDLPHPLVKIIEPLLRKDPGERTQSSAEVLDQLERLQRSLSRGFFGVKKNIVALTSVVVLLMMLVVLVVGMPSYFRERAFEEVRMHLLAIEEVRGNLDEEQPMLRKVSVELNKLEEEWPLDERMVDLRERFTAAVAEVQNDRLDLLKVRLYAGEIKEAIEIRDKMLQLEQSGDRIEGAKTLVEKTEALDRKLDSLVSKVTEAFEGKRIVKLEQAAESISSLSSFSIDDHDYAPAKDEARTLKADLVVLLVSSTEAPGDLTPAERLTLEDLLQTWAPSARSTSSPEHSALEYLRQWQRSEKLVVSSGEEGNTAESLRAILKNLEPLGFPKQTAIVTDKLTRLLGRADAKALALQLFREQSLEKITALNQLRSNEFAREAAWLDRLKEGLGTLDPTQAGICLEELRKAREDLQDEFKAAAQALLEDLSARRWHRTVQHRVLERKSGEALSALTSWRAEPMGGAADQEAAADLISELEAAERARTEIEKTLVAFRQSLAKENPDAAKEQLVALRPQLKGAIERLDQEESLARSLKSDTNNVERLRERARFQLYLGEYAKAQESCRLLSKDNQDPDGIRIQASFALAIDSDENVSAALEDRLQSLQDRLVMYWYWKGILTDDLAGLRTANFLEPCASLKHRLAQAELGNGEWAVAVANSKAARHAPWTDFGVTVLLGWHPASLVDRYQKFASESLAISARAHWELEQYALSAENLCAAIRRSDRIDDPTIVDLERRARSAFRSAVHDREIERARSIYALLERGSRTTIERWESSLEAEGQDRDDLRTGLLHAFLLLGDSEKAIPLAQRLKQAKPNDGPVLFDWGLALLLKKKDEAVLLEICRALDAVVDPSPRLRELRGASRILWEGIQEEPSEAALQSGQQDLQVSIDEGRRDSSLFFSYALAEMSKADPDYQEAERRITEALELEFTELGFFLQFDGGFRSAAEPDSIRDFRFQLFRTRGTAKFKLENFTGSVSDFDEALSIREHELELWLRGLAKWKLGQLESALEDLGRSYELKGDPDKEPILRTYERKYEEGGE